MELSYHTFVPDHLQDAMGSNMGFGVPEAFSYCMIIRGFQGDQNIHNRVSFLVRWFVVPKVVVIRVEIDYISCVVPKIACVK